MPTTVPKGLEYDKYLKYVVPTQGWHGGGDAGFEQDPNFKPMTEEEWNALPNAQKYGMLEKPMSAAPDSISPQTFGGEGDIADEDDAGRFRSKFGKNDYGNKSGREGDDRIIWGYGDLPKIYGADPSEYMIDPSRVYRDEDGRWMIEANNIKGDWLAEQRKNQNRTFNRGVWQTAFKMAAAAAGGYYSGGGVDPSAVAATDAAESGGTLSLNAAGNATTPYVPSGMEGAAATPGTLPPGTQAPAPVTEVAPPSYPPGTQAPAPVTSASPAVPGSTTNGIVNAVRTSPLGGAMDWYNSLTPAGRMVVNAGVSTGAQAILGANAQRNAQQHATEVEQRQRDDRIRRGQVRPVGTSAFTPKPGIIASRRGG